MTAETLRQACSCEENNRNIRVAIHFAGMLLVACKQYIFPTWETNVM